MAHRAQNRSVWVFIRRFQSTTPSLRDTPPVQEGNRVDASERSFSENLTALPVLGGGAARFDTTQAKRLTEGKGGKGIILHSYYKEPVLFLASSLY